MNRDRVSYLTENFAATPDEPAMLRLEGCSDTSVYIQLLQLRGRRSEEALYYRLIEEECGKTECDVRKELTFIQSMKSPVEINQERYYIYGAYTLNVLNDKEALLAWIDKLSRYLYLRDRIIQKFEFERMPFSVFEKELTEARALLSEMLSYSRKKELIQAIKDICPDLSDNTEEFDRVAADMHLSVDVLGFVPEEYVSYHFRENSVLVKKNNFQSLGKETEIIEVTESTDLHALYERIAENGRYFILEDLIRPHPELKRLNPDSVNTVRIVTFKDREEPVVPDSFLRAGRRGSFVDNGGSA